MFHEGDLQSGIELAVQQSKAVLCFVDDDTETSAQWKDILEDETISHAIAAQAVALRLQAGSPEAGFLTPICAINSTPAIVVIKDAQVQMNLQSAEVPFKELKPRLSTTFSTQQNRQAQETSEPSSTDASDVAVEYLDLQPQPGQMRLPNNAYDALRNYTQKLLDEGKPHSDVFETQLTLLNNIPIFKEEVSNLRGPKSRRELSEYARSRLLRLPAVGLKIPDQSKTAAASSSQLPQQSIAPSNPPVADSEGEGVYPTPNRTAPAPQTQSQLHNTPHTDSSQQAAIFEPDEKQKAQRQEYIRMQREREQAAQAERERIKAQIKTDREERRRVDELRKQGYRSSETDTDSTSTYARGGARSHATADVRVQVRTFDGSTLRTSLPASSRITDKLRPWIDEATSTNVPYNLKLILTPLPNRTIEAGEEDTSLSDLGIVGSCTLVMVPVKGYVESYSTGAGGLMGQNGLLGGVGGMVSGGYNIVSGTAGWALGGVKSLLGYGGQQVGTTGASSSSTSTPSAEQGAGGPKNVRIRTLADQRAEEAKKNQQFYNGNQLNFEPKKDDDGKKN
ncbi:hypothetical protein A1O7_08075 [Cladophialophora yegresii CBS 114405]|uniref:UBX domain-containing protein n=1 Tax=Cladophialophora yegresii CBS 114405 TaxID=1182544 RepID=W9VQ55_9EURO|nr:uncharacterized protein A1O7_08075 [Cladophialophora yegresii CBS 114405]EXJ55150.1 hypothetical protein A1O7_08075 [Cladophialophora yegresii CBS 114405]